jgi:hypothetical protein
VSDLRLFPQTNRHIAAATALQLYGGMDPDGSRDLAERIVFAVDRAGARGHTGSAPTEDEVTRAHNALARRGVACARDRRLRAARGVRLRVAG